MAKRYRPGSLSERRGLKGYKRSNDNAAIKGLGMASGISTLAAYGAAGAGPIGAAAGATTGALLSVPTAYFAFKDLKNAQQHAKRVRLSRQSGSLSHRRAVKQRSGGGPVKVKGYTRPDGVQVKPYTRSR